ncbi:MAG: type I restriction endonuclease subunit R [Opitutaceae bacterium]|jgi:type I restriction enzyme R subunit|nr:type I restriction endonuclease subunit R [Opitutaceae bacterium]MBP8962423.1 type I restriction endonuclease subunit R [Opitutaceae bacterium]HOD48177.1 type I restriction endonuclease subunit R [Opitutaceae bacterium]HOG02527.1 type I restriction endonuclease subunit R [Accumulibacter sp.]HQL20561.1 type I restriction endonuclease subunit R [Opitutaceae bacterium]
MPLNESTVEEAALGWFSDLNYAVGHGPAMAPGEPQAERDTFGEVVLVDRLRAAIHKLNPEVPADSQEEALRKVLRLATPSLVQSNRAFHTLLRNGIDVEYARTDGTAKHDKVWLVDFENERANDWLAVNQYTVIEAGHNRRADIVVFVNGLPLGLIELKNAADGEATIWSAYAQLQTYKAEVPSLLHYNALLIVSDGVEARVGSLTANQEWFKVWRTIEGDGDAPKSALELEVLMRGVFERRRFLQLLQHFIVFEDDPDTGAVHKIIAGYHQFHAVNAAIDETVRASGMGVAGQVDEDPGTYWSGKMSGGKPGDRRAGVVWHTQGSGKSFTMLFFAGRVIREAAMQNPTLVVLTDRNDLDDQLFGQFQRCHEILGQTPVQAPSREKLRELLAVASGGVVFTTIQKFMPEKGEKMPCLSQRRNIVVIADEAHRSQYDLIDGLARHLRDALPGASFIGFTGTPIEKTDANTRAVFGDYISIYDIQRAVTDQATVPIYYESRIAKLGLNTSELPKLDAEFEEITEGEESTRKEKLKTKWAALEALVGDPKRLALVAADLVAHFEKRSEANNGKAMIVCMSRRICVDLYAALTKLRPEWASAKDDDSEAEKGKACVVKVVMTGSADDGPGWQPHIRNKERRRKLANRFKDSKDPFRIVIVRDMWLTGFDAPCLHTMYADKPMQGHGLMQAIARVNRVFRNKPGGLVVDYLGLAEQLKKALATYTESGGKGDPTYDTRQAIAVMLEKYGIACDMLHGFDWAKWTTGTPAEKLGLIPAGQEHILTQDEGKRRWIQNTIELSRAFALCAASDEATEIRDDVSFFQALQATLSKKTTTTQKTPEQLDAAVRQLVSQAITTEGEVIDVFTAAGLPKPDIGILSEQFLAEVRGLKYKNVAAELLEKLLNDEIKVRGKRNLVQAQVFSDKLRQALNAYHNRAISTVEFIDELIKMAKQLSQIDQHNEALKLSPEEVAFYDALAANESAKQVMGDETLRVIATELITQVRKSVTIDWTIRESAQAKIRVLVKRILNRFGYPPDMQDAAVKTVLEQAKLLCAEWAA